MSCVTKEQALDFMCRTAEGIALMFGSKCETLVHDMAVQGHPIVAIYNNGVSGRGVGSTLDIYGEDGLGGSQLITEKNYCNNMVVSVRGQKIKSSTFNLKGDEFWYALGVNFDYTEIEGSMQFLSELMSVNSDLVAEMETVSGGKLEEIYQNALSLFKKPPQKLTKGERVRLIGILNENGAFKFHKSVPFVSEQLQVSRYTIYKYLKELDE